MKTQGSNAPMDLDVEWVSGQCRDALARDFAGLGRRLSNAPQTPVGWFDLLRGFPRSTLMPLRQIKESLADEADDWPCSAVERFAILNALLVAVRVMPSLPVDSSVKGLFNDLCLKVANPPDHWIAQFDLAGEPFMELAQLATLRRHPAGQSVFEITALPVSWLLKIHPLDLPETLHQLMFDFGGFSAYVAPHLNHWRANPSLLLETENQFSMLRITKSIERQPLVRGLMADGWMFSAELGATSPHLAWLRQFFVDNGAYLVDMESASPRSGFLVGSARRKALYEKGLFRPRRTLVLWGRGAMLAWAASHPLIEEMVPQSSKQSGARHRSKPVNRPSRRPILDGTTFLNRQPKLYMLATLVVPSLAVAVLTGILVSPLAAFGAMAIAFLAMWLTQYFAFQ